MMSLTKWRSVLLESYKNSSITDNSLYTSSGVMLNEKYILTTSNIFLPHFEPHETESLLKLKTSKIHNFEYPKIKVNIVWKNHSDDSLFKVEPAKVFGIFLCNNIQWTSKQTFTEWAVDSPENNRDIPVILSMFFILTLGNSSDDFNAVLQYWWSLISYLQLNKGDQLCAVTVPFGNRHFLESHSKGIVSNVFGRNSSLLLSDCPTAPGSEGSPVYLQPTQKKFMEDTDPPIALVLSALSWWKGEWVGLTLLADLRAILVQVVDFPVGNLDKVVIPSLHFKLLANLDSSLVQVYSGSNWGTAIFVNESKGVFLTNAHIIDTHAYQTKLYWKNKIFPAKVLYKNTNDSVFDLAVIQCTANLCDFGLRALKFAHGTQKVGDLVYSAGYSFFPKELSPSPTLSQGHISQINRHMLKTTCCVHPGASGGAILTPEGILLAVIVSNTKLQENGVVYPRVNMAIPIGAVQDILYKYYQTGDISCLGRLKVDDQETIRYWSNLQGKL